MLPRIAIVDYEVGNLHSVAKAFAYVGCTPTITRDPGVLAAADGVVFPGVGAFPAAMTHLEQSGLVPVVKELAHSGKPFFGICVGEELLFDAGEEFTHTPGLGIIPGTVTRLPDRVKLPQIGWNQVQVTRDHPIFSGLPDQFYAYFNHSYAAEDTPAEFVLGTCDYGRVFPAVVCRGAVVATQFHPEKSSRAGLTLLANFVNLTARAAGQEPCAAVPAAHALKGAAS